MGSNNNHLMQALSRYAALVFCRADESVERDIRNPREKL